jgi:hypothetical protein
MTTQVFYDISFKLLSQGNLMSELDSLENIPLRDLCKEAERLTREVIDHLENNLIPKSQELHNLVMPDSPFAESGELVQDITVRNQASTLQESQDFTEQLFKKTSQYFTEIDRHIIQLTGG